MLEGHRTNDLRRRLARKILGRLPLSAPPPELLPISAEQLEEIRHLFPLQKFFIFGYPRSGTTLLMRLISLHPKVHCNREAHFFTRDEDATRIFADHEIRQWLEKRSNRWTSGQELETPLVRLMADFIMEREANRLGKTVVGDKTPNSNAGEAVKRLQAVYPDARLIYIVRDGRDAAVSHRFQHFIDHPQYLSREDRRIRQDYAKDSRPYLTGKRSIFSRHAIHDEAQAWKQNVTDTHALGRELFSERYICLRYEDLLKDPIEHACRLWGFLRVEPAFPGMADQVKGKMEYNPGAEAQQQKGENISRNLRRGQQGTWQDFFTARDRQVFKEIAGHALIEWGYENTLDW